jgi:hypothetical protein
VVALAPMRDRQDRQDRIASAAGGRPAPALWLAPLLLALSVAGCAIEAPLFVADTGKYQFYNCEQLANSAKVQAVRQRDLKELIDKAEQGTAGVVVSVIAYRSDYVAVTEDLRVIEMTARDKNCVTPSTWQSNSVIR